MHARPCAVCRMCKGHCLTCPCCCQALSSKTSTAALLRALGLGSRLLRTAPRPPADPLVLLDPPVGCLGVSNGSRSQTAPSVPDNCVTKMTRLIGRGSLPPKQCCPPLTLCSKSCTTAARYMVIRGSASWGDSQGEEHTPSACTRSNRQQSLSRCECGAAPPPLAPSCGIHHTPRL